MSQYKLINIYIIEFLSYIDSLKMTNNNLKKKYKLKHDRLSKRQPRARVDEIHEYF